MVKNSSGAVQYVSLEDLVSYEAGKGRTGKTVEPQSAEKEVDEDKLPETIIPADTRLNLNVATAEAIAKSVKGIGYATARRLSSFGFLFLASVSRISISSKRLVVLTGMRSSQLM